MRIIQNFIMKISQEAVIQAFTLVGLIIIMFAMSPSLALFSLVPVPIVVFVGRRFGKTLGPKYMRMWRRGAAISTMLADSIPGVRVIKAFTNEKTVAGKLDILREFLIKASLSMVQYMVLLKRKS